MGTIESTAYFCIGAIGRSCEIYTLVFQLLEHGGCKNITANLPPSLCSRDRFDLEIYIWQLRTGVLYF